MIATQVSRPIRSASARGPSGCANPSFAIVSIASAPATPSCSAQTASLMNGIRMRLETKPGKSFATAGVLPSSSASPMIPAAVSSDVSRPRMISTSFKTGTGLKKCIPMTLSGRRVAAASEPIGMDEVFEASTASGGNSASARRKISSLTSASSITASIMRSAGARSSTASMRASTSSAGGPPFSSSLPRILRIASSARSVAPGCASCSDTRRPDAATTCAIPAPICPAPTTSTCSKLMSASLTPLGTTAAADEEPERQEQDQRQEENVPTGDDVDEHCDRKSGEKHDERQGHDCCVTTTSSLHLEQQCIPLAAARADRRQAQTTAVAPKLVDHRAEDACPRGADRVAERHRTTVHVHLLRVDGEHLDRVEHHRRESLVELHALDVANLLAGFCKCRRSRLRGRPRQIREVIGDISLRDDRREHLQPALPCELFAGHDERARSVVHSRRIAGSRRPVRIEHRLQPGELLVGRISAWDLVDGEVADRNDFFLEFPPVDRAHRPLVRAQRPPVLVLARDAELARDE